ncbi:hypothetical protein EAI_14808 [Harpegnathos saltator]|uniref:Uncharacterized protein n=1 Tax=Harpegnathos saltator TaxID=610380 RepID=E2BFS5_HARSA|nr:hypothetical protein EAI_14808 [Harpegnathos saltator]
MVLKTAEDIEKSLLVVLLEVVKSQGNMVQVSPDNIGVEGHKVVFEVKVRKRTPRSSEAILYYMMVVSVLSDICCNKTILYLKITSTNVPGDEKFHI